MTTEEKTRQAWPLAAILVLIIWSALVWVISKYTWGHGQLTFFMLVGLVVLLSQTPRVVRWLGRMEPVRILSGMLGLALLILLLSLGNGLVAELQHKKNDNWAVDIGVNTYLAGTAFLNGKNPYEERAQAWHAIKPGPNVTVEGREVHMFGYRYTYGFPYFPVMFLSYLPGRLFASGYHALRVENALLLLANLAGIFWLVRSTARKPESVALGLLGCVAYLASPVLREELFRLAITDIVIAAYAVFAFVALRGERWLLAGALLGLAQGCKLLPGPLLVLPVLVWLWPKPQVWRVLAAYLAVSLATLLPFVLRDPELFLSSTVLFYLTFHAVGDNTSLWFFLPESIQPVFRGLGLLLTLAVAVYPYFRRTQTVIVPLVCAFLSYVVFVAFSNMTHLNYLWGVFSLGAAAAALLIGEGLTRDAPELERRGG